ncbi:MAG TPA: hypothetical protein VHR86_05840, partial [Armatimonadota bacterium]|nr:hypothetical protein [Armatimonadota bacterium]
MPSLSSIPSINQLTRTAALALAAAVCSITAPGLALAADKPQSATTAPTNAAQNPAPRVLSLEDSIQVAMEN